MAFCFIWDDIFVHYRWQSITLTWLSQKLLLAKSVKLWNTVGLTNKRHFAATNILTERQIEMIKGEQIFTKRFLHTPITVCTGVHIVNHYIKKMETLILPESHYHIWSVIIVAPAYSVPCLVPVDLLFVGKLLTKKMYKNNYNTNHINILRHSIRKFAKSFFIY